MRRALNIVAVLFLISAASLSYGQDQPALDAAPGIFGHSGDPSYPGSIPILPKPYEFTLPDSVNSTIIDYLRNKYNMPSTADPQSLSSMFTDYCTFKTNIAAQTPFGASNTYHTQSLPQAHPELWNRLIGLSAPSSDNAVFTNTQPEAVSFVLQVGDARELVSVSPSQPQTRSVPQDKAAHVEISSNGKLMSFSVVGGVVYAVRNVSGLYFIVPN